MAYSPEPGLAPDVVLKTVLAALQRNDDPMVNSGVATAYAFASPTLRNMLGTYQQFANHFEHGDLHALLRHQQAHVALVRQTAAKAEMLVIVVSATQQPAGYIFSLSRQTDPSTPGCWMADMITPVEAELKQRPVSRTVSYN